MDMSGEEIVKVDVFKYMYSTMQSTGQSTRDVREREQGGVGGDESQ